jgi:hypothetical protein
MLLETKSSDSEKKKIRNDLNAKTLSEMSATGTTKGLPVKTAQHTTAKIPQSGLTRRSSIKTTLDGTFSNDI